MFASRHSQRLRGRDYKRVLDAVAVLHGADAPPVRVWNAAPVTAFARRLLAALAVIVPESSFASIAVLPEVEKRNLTVVASARIHSDLPSVGTSLGEELGRVIRKHAGYQRLQDLCLAGHVLADVQVMSKHEVKGSAPFCELYQPREADFHALFTMPGPTAPYWVAIFRRSDPIADREVAMLRTLRDHLRSWPADATKFETAATDSRNEGKWRRLCDIGLSPAEAEVMRWACEGKRDGEIAIILGKSVRTVQVQMRAIFEKLGVETRTRAATVVLEHLRNMGE